MKDNIDKLIEDKIFQYFFHKTYKDKKDYKIFKEFKPDIKIDFLIELYLFTTENKKLILQEEEKEFEKNTEMIKLNFQKILDKYKLPDYKEFIIDPRIDSKGRITFQKEEKKLNQNYKLCKTYSEGIYNNINMNNNNNYTSFEKYNDQNDIETFNKRDTTFPKTIYSKINFDLNTLIINTENFKTNNIYNLEENYEAKYKFDFPNIKSVKNNIIENPKKKNLSSSSKFLNIQSTNKSEIDFRSNFFYKDYKYLSNPSMKSNINKSLQFYINSNNISNSSLTYSKNNIIINPDMKIFKKPNKKKGILINDLILINESISQNSKIPFREFNGKDLVDRLFKCPNDKFITLDYFEASKIAQIILEYMRSEKELKIISEDLKNEIKKLNILYNEEKNKQKNTEKELNELKIKYENKKNMIEKYIDNLSERLEITKEEFNEIENNNNFYLDEKTKQEILNEINQNLEMIN